MKSPCAAQGLQASMLSYIATCLMPSGLFLILARHCYYQDINMISNKNKKLEFCSLGMCPPKNVSNLYLNLSGLQLLDQQYLVLEIPSCNKIQLNTTGFTTAKS